MKNHRRSSALKSYFYKHNLGFSDSVNADIARYKINLVFDKLNHSTDPISYFEIVNLLMSEKASLLFLLNHYKLNDSDNRSGFESYGFTNWQADLLYISDRFTCRFRIQWILDLFIHLKLDEVGA
jgi:hypothetical protein